MMLQRRGSGAHDTDNDAVRVAEAWVQHHHSLQSTWVGATHELILLGKREVHAHRLVATNQPGSAGLNNKAQKKVPILGS